MNNIEPYVVTENEGSESDDGLVWRVGYYKGIRTAGFDRHCLKNPGINGQGPKDPCWVWTDFWTYVCKFVPGDYTDEEIIRRHVPNQYVWSMVRGPKPKKLPLEKPTFPDDSVLMGIRMLDLEDE